MRASLDTGVRHDLPAQIVLATALLLALLLAGCSGPPAHRPATLPAASITLGAPARLEAALPLLVAEEQGFFARNGLTVDLRAYDSGRAAMTGLSNGEVDVAGPMSEYVLAGEGLKGASAQALASIDRLEFTFVVARKDHGIASATDLRGRRVGVVRGTSPEFYLSRFLELHGIDPEEVDLVDTASLPTGAEMMVRGDVDALVSPEPYASQAAEQLGDKAVMWSAQSSQPAYSLLVTRRDWIADHPDAAHRLLRAVDEAVDHIAQNPDNAKRIARERLDLTDERLATVWPRNQFALSLDMALVIAMEDQARWMIEKGLADAKQVPDFGQYVHLEALRAVKPEAVKVIR
jgi:NitT/TauT family transport system substrate-binding protein